MTLWTDLVYTLRQWRKRPTFALLVILTLALGIGANAAIFSVVDGVLLRDLPYRQPERLVMVYSQFPTMGFDKFWVSPPEFDELRRWSSSFEELGAYRLQLINVSGGDRPHRVQGTIASAGALRALGVDPIAGRLFEEREDLPDGPAAVILGEELWRRAFGGDRSLIGETVDIEGEARTLVGVLPAAVDLEDAGVEVWMPLGIDLTDQSRRANHLLYLVGRLADGVTVQQAQQEIAGLVERWEGELPDSAGHTPRPEVHGMVVTSLKEELVGATRPRLELLAWAVGLVLLVACANVANLLLARAEERQREIAVRTALGAHPGRLTRQFLTEAVVLSLAGGALGIVLANLGLRLMLAADPEAIVRAGEIAIDGRVLLFTLAVSLVTGVLFGLAPALHVRGKASMNVLRDGGRSGAGRGRRRFRWALVVAEVALAALLVVGAGLLLRSFQQLLAVDPGFKADGALTFQLSLPERDYPETSDLAAFYTRLQEELAAMPGVTASAAMSGLPPVRPVSANDTEFESVPRDPEGPSHNVDYYQFVTPGYFETMDIEVVAGRPFGEGDLGIDNPVVMINRTMQQLFWPDSNPIGQRVKPNDDEVPWFTIIGIVEDVKQGGIGEETGTELYLLANQAWAAGFPIRTLNLVARTQGEPQTVMPAVQRLVQRLDPALPIASLRPLEAVVSSSLAERRLVAMLVSLFAAVALLLAAVGTYGVLSYAVEQRRHELGVRMALGARGSNVLSLVLRQGLTVVAVGLALGMLGALALRKVLASQLFGVSPTDPATFATVGLLLAAVAVVACAVPALKAARVDPIETLKSE